jgi:hypothetical protein
MDPEREQLAERRRRRYQDIAGRRDACDLETDALRVELAEVRRELELERARLGQEIHA